MVYSCTHTLTQLSLFLYVHGFYQYWRGNVTWRSKENIILICKLYLTDMKWLDCISLLCFYIHTSIQTELRNFINRNERAWINWNLDRNKLFSLCWFSCGLSFFFYQWNRVTTIFSTICRKFTVCWTSWIS